MSNLLLNERPLVILPSLVRTLGSVTEAVVLQQLHFNLVHIDSRAVEIDGVKWVKAGIDYWCNQLPIFSEPTIKRAFGSLREKGLVATQRGREESVYTIHYDALTVYTDQNDPQHGPERSGETDQNDPSPCKGEVTEDGGENVAASSAASGEAPALPGLEPPTPPAPPTTPESALVDDVFAHYVMVFGERLRVKELTDPRRRTIKKALSAVNDDTALLKQAIDGLKSYRDTHPDGSNDISLSVIFATGPQDRSNLTEKIEWWAGHSEGKADIPSSVPSALRGRVLELAGTVLKREQQPDSEAVAQRAIQAEAQLAERFKLKVVSDGNGKLLRWEAVA